MKLKQGFTLIEMMLGLLYISMILLLIVMTQKILVKKAQSLEFFNQNKIGLIQLQNELTVSHSFSKHENQICYTKYENNFCLMFDQDRLVKTPGYEIYLIDLKNPQFFLNDFTIEIRFHHNKEEINEKIKIIP